MSTEVPDIRRVSDQIRGTFFVTDVDNRVIANNDSLRPGYIFVKRIDLGPDEREVTVLRCVVRSRMSRKCDGYGTRTTANRIVDRISELGMCCRLPG